MANLENVNFNDENYSNLKILRNIPSTKSLFGIFMNKENISNSKKSRSSRGKFTGEVKKSVKVVQEEKNISQRALNYKKRLLDGNKYTFQDKESIKSKFKKNKISVSALSRQSGIPSTTLYTWTSGLETKRVKRKYSVEEKKEMLKIFRQSNLSLSQAAKKFDVPMGTLINWVYNKKVNSKLIRQTAVKTENGKSTRKFPVH